MTYRSAGFQPASAGPEWDLVYGPDSAPLQVAEPRGWYSRGYLPHFDGGAETQFITFRLHDSLPRSLVNSWQEELDRLPEAERPREHARRTNLALDEGNGACWLRRPEIAEIVVGALRYFDGVRYRLHEWVVMPNHVHVIAERTGEGTLAEIVKSWKGYSAREANRLLGRSGAFWFREYFDRWIRDADHFANVARYVRQNPVRAGLCAAPEEWAFSSAFPRP